MNFDDALNDLENAACIGNPVECKRILEENHEFPGFLEQCTPALIDVINYSDMHVPKTALDNLLVSTKTHANTHLSCLRIFLSLGVPIESDDDHCAAIRSAVRTGPSNEYMHLLLDDPQYIDVNGNHAGKSALSLAVDNLHGGDKARGRDQVISLITRRADLHAVDHQGNSLLHHRSSYDSWLLHILYLKEIDFNRKGQFERTPLHALIHTEAARGRWGFGHPGAIRPFQASHVEIADLFLEYGADVHIQDYYGRTVIQLAEAVLPLGNPVLELLQATERMLAFAMGMGPGNIENCLMRELPPELVRAIARPPEV